MVKVTEEEKAIEGWRKEWQKFKNKPHPCWIDCHNYDWKDCPIKLQNKNRDKDKDFSNKWYKIKFDKSKRKSNSSQSIPPNTICLMHLTLESNLRLILWSLMISQTTTASITRGEVLMMLTKSRN